MSHSQLVAKPGQCGRRGRGGTLRYEQGSQRSGRKPRFTRAEVIRISGDISPLFCLPPGIELATSSIVSQNPLPSPCLPSCSLPGVRAKPGLTGLGGVGTVDLSHWGSTWLVSLGGPGRDMPIPPSLWPPVSVLPASSLTLSGLSCALPTSTHLWPNICLFCFVLFPHWNH